MCLLLLRHLRDILPQCGGVQRGNTAAKGAVLGMVKPCQLQPLIRDSLQRIIQLQQKQGVRFRNDIRERSRHIPSRQDFFQILHPLFRRGGFPAVGDPRKAVRQYLR